MDGQKYNIPLDSPLDINSNDMLVKASSPSFAFNRQRYLGSLLQSSIRYEDDGWFAGWWGHTFGAANTGTAEISPPLGDPDRLVVAPFTDQNGAKYYKVSQGDRNVSFLWSIDEYVKWNTGSGTVASSGNQATITGKTVNGTDFTLIIDLTTGAEISFDCPDDPALKANIQFVSGRFNIKIERENTDDYIHIRPNRTVDFADIKLAYRRDETKSYWGDQLDGGNYPFELTDDNDLVCNDADTFELESFTVEDADTETEHIVAEIIVNAHFNLDIVIQLEYRAWKDLFDKRTVWWYNDQRKGIAPDKHVHTLVGRVPEEYPDPDNPGGVSLDGILSPIVMDNWDVNKEWVWGLSHDPSELDPEGKVTLIHGIPIWMTFDAAAAVTFDFSTVAQGYLKAQINDSRLIGGSIEDEITDPGVINAELIDNSGGAEMNGNISWDNASATELYKTGVARFPGNLTLKNNNPNYPVDVYWDAGFSVGVTASRSTDAAPWQYTIGEATGSLQVPENPPIPFEQYIGYGDCLNRPGTAIITATATSDTTYDIIYHSILCYPGFAIGRVDTVDIIKYNISAFELTEVTNDEIGIKCWRIDSGGPGGEGLGDWAIGKANMKLSEFRTQAGDGGAIAKEGHLTVLDKYLVVDLVPMTDPAPKHNTFYYLTKAPPEGYPPWCDDPSKWIDTSEAMRYTPGRNTLTSAQIDFKVQTIEILVQFAQIDKEVDPVNQFSSGLLSRLSPHVEVEKIEQIELPLTQEVKIKITPEEDYTTFIYDVMSQSVQDPTHFYTNYELEDYSSSMESVNEPHRLNMSLKFKYKKTFTAEFWRTFIIEATGLAENAEIVKQINKTVTLTDEYGIIDLSSYRIDKATKYVYSGRKSQGVYSTKLYVTVTGANASLEYLPKGILQKSSASIEYVSSTDTTLTFTYDGQTYTLTISEGYSMDFRYDVTDIRNGAKKNVYIRDVSDVRMFVKQFWSNTVDVENFWWIDEYHVLELSKYYLTLYRKLPTLHDWMGDNWEVLKRAERAIFFTTDDLYYTCSYALRSIPYLFKLQTPNNDTIKLMYIEDILSADFENPTWTEVEIPIQKVELGEELPGDALGCFIQLQASAVVNRGKISSTVVDGTFILAIKLNRGLQQWALKFDGSSFSVLYGYGNVGLDGCLTGGMIPDVACDGEKGFNQVVHPLIELIREEEEGEDPSEPEEGAWQILPNECYGTVDCVWFIYDQINKIVSHFKFVGGAFVPEYLNLNNNITAMFQSLSFGVQGLFDYFPESCNIMKLLGETSTLLNVLSEVMLPSIFYLNIMYSTFLYINQSLGMYAYKWFNSTQQQVESKDTSDDQRVSDVDIRFFKSLFTEECSENTNIDFWTRLITRALVLLATNIDFRPNATQNQTATSDSRGRKWTSFVVNNVSDLISTALDQYGCGFSLKSSISLDYSLKQFYNISNKQECYAGPGFVDMQLTGQCIAQGCTDFQVEAQRINYWATLKQLTALLIRIRILLLDVAIEAIDKYSADNAGVTTGAGFAIIPLSVVIAGITTVATALMKALRMFWVAALEVVCGDGGLCDMLGPDVGTPSISSKLQKRTFDIEAPHAYGTKPMTFMWPCFGIDKPCTYTNEAVRCTYNTTKQMVRFAGNSEYSKSLWSDKLKSTLPHNSWFRTGKDEVTGEGNPDTDLMDAHLYNVYITCKGDSWTETAPEDMAVIEGITKFLPAETFKNINIGESDPIFSHPHLQDFIIDKNWALGVTGIGGEQFSICCDDTKLIDGAPSNIVINDAFCGVASSYVAIEVKNGYDPDYLRPWAITPNTIALNINRVNTVHDAKAYHAFHGEGRRIVQWTGGAGMHRDFKFQHFWFEQNDHFKRSNIYPPAHFQGDFQCPPSIAVRSYAAVYNDISCPELQIGMKNDVPGENRSLIRVSVPVHSETLNTLPAMVRMLGPYKLAVVEGITSLVTDARYAQSAYKAPSSVDFDINGNMFRATEEFVCTVVAQGGTLDVKDTVACAGLTYVGATTREAYFYSPATRMYYSFGGGREMTKQDIFHRFKDIKEGRWDYVNQEVMFKCLLANRMNEVPDLWHDTIIGRLDGKVLGELYPPPPPIYDQVSDFKLLSMAGGLCYQGPRRFVVNRFVINEHMYPDILMNKKRWKRLSRYEYTPERDYMWAYDDWHTVTPGYAVKGWTYNAYRLVTSMLGIDEETDCKFEWELTFAWTEQMDKLFEQNEFVTVNLQAETVTQGGTLLSPVTHIFLFKECFTRAGNSGYYTFQFNGKNGMGNRERLYIWSDGITALEDLQLITKDLTTRRTQPLHTQIDVRDLKEQ